MNKSMGEKSFGIVFTAIGAISGAFNAVENYLSNKRSREYLEKLNEIISEIRKDISQVLDKLDKLPLEIRAIVTDIVENAFLNEKYIELQSIEVNFYELGDTGSFRIHTEGWFRISNILFYLCNRENRLSYMPNFLRACEFAMLASNNGGKPVIMNAVRKKYGLINSLLFDLKSIFLQECGTLKGLLDNNEYIDSHNFDENIEDLSKINYIALPNKATTETYQDQECHEECFPSEADCEGGGRCRLTERCYQRCRPVTRSRSNESGIRYNNQKTGHINKIEQQKEVVIKYYSQVVDVMAVLKLLEKYIENLSSEKDMPLILYEDPMINYFSILPDDEIKEYKSFFTT